MDKAISKTTQIDDIFAIGCFSFVDYSAEDDESRLNDYSNNIIDALSKIDNVSNIVVNGISSFAFFPFHPDKEDGYSNIPFRPCPSSGLVSFDIFIPARVQRDVFPLGEARIDCEHFSLLVDYTGDFPVSILRPSRKIAGDKSSGFSDFVPIVRDYLASRWPPEAKVKFACLGPSPFHAEFYYRVGTANEITVERQRGYDRIFLRAPIRRISITR